MESEEQTTTAKDHPGYTVDTINAVKKLKYGRPQKQNSKQEQQTECLDAIISPQTSSDSQTMRHSD